MRLCWCDLMGVRTLWERYERKRLERITASKEACVQLAAPVPDASPMEAEGDGGSAKRARLTSHPEVKPIGESAEGLQVEAAHARPV